MTIQIPWLHPDILDFPSPFDALDEPNGVLALGGDLSTDRLIEAYSRGIFPWYNEGEPVIWWSPSPRAVYMVSDHKLSRTNRKLLNRYDWTFTYDHLFEQVIEECSKDRADQLGTWITEEMKQAYIELHKLGVAHSVETWLDGELVGGLYGVAIGQCFFGESMFSRVSNGSKLAFNQLNNWLSQWNYKMVDGQVESDHLTLLGFKSLPRTEFIEKIDSYVNQNPAPEAWDPPCR